MKATPLCISSPHVLLRKISSSSCRRISMKRSEWMEKFTRLLAEKRCYTRADPPAGKNRRLCHGRERVTR